jgi:UDP-N-acetylmuramyl pentapeptide phosphotransferase/UDP-N-acetylglucosamine-1-phosphate transferase
MFMGDVGSAPLGFLLAALVLWIAGSYGWWLLVPLAMLHANFVLDTGFTLVRRMLRGERWYEAHREHFYQRLIRAGKSHAFVTGWEMGLQTLVALLMCLYVLTAPVIQVIIAGAVIAVWTVFFWYSDKAFAMKVKVAGAGVQYQKPIVNQRKMDSTRPIQ